MIYGRRFFEKNQHRLSRYEQQTERFARTQRSLKSLYHHFQHKYARYFVLTIMLPTILFALPCLYFLNQNYEIFLKLAYDVRPELIVHLERERSLLLGLIGFMLVGSAGFCYILTLKLTGHIVGPIWSLERHMKQVTLGDWSSEDFRVRQNDEFQSLASSYSYMYRTLKVHTLKEIEALESLGLDPRDRNTYITIRNLIDTKKAQLGINPADEPTFESVEGTSASPGSRRAS